MPEDNRDIEEIKAKRIEQVDLLFSNSPNFNTFYDNTFELFETYYNICNRILPKTDENGKHSKIESIKRSNKLYFYLLNIVSDTSTVEEEEYRRDAYSDKLLYCLSDLKNDPNKFLLFPINTSKHLFTFVVKYFDDCYSVTLVNAGSENDQYKEYKIDQENSLIEALTKFIEPVSEKNDVDYAHEQFRKKLENTSATPNKLNIRSMPQQIGNCALKELEKGLRFGLFYDKDDVIKAREPGTEEMPPPKFPAEFFMDEINFELIGIIQRNGAINEPLEKYIFSKILPRDWEDIYGSANKSIIHQKFVCLLNECIVKDNNFYDGIIANEEIKNLVKNTNNEELQMLLERKDILGQRGLPFSSRESQKLNMLIIQEYFQWRYPREGLVTKKDFYQRYIEELSKINGEVNTNLLKELNKKYEIYKKNKIFMGKFENILCKFGLRDCGRNIPEVDLTTAKEFYKKTLKLFVETYITEEPTNKEINYKTAKLLLEWCNAFKITNAYLGQSLEGKTEFRKFLKYIEKQDALENKIKRVKDVEEQMKKTKKQENKEKLEQQKKDMNGLIWDAISGIEDFYHNFNDFGYSTLKYTQVKNIADLLMKRFIKPAEDFLPRGTESMEKLKLALNDIFEKLILNIQICPRLNFYYAGKLDIEMENSTIALAQYNNFIEYYHNRFELTHFYFHEVKQIAIFLNRCADFAQCSSNEHEEWTELSKLLSQLPRFEEKKYKYFDEIDSNFKSIERNVTSEARISNDRRKETISLSQSSRVNGESANFQPINTTSGNSSFKQGWVQKGITLLINLPKNLFNKKTKLVTTAQEGESEDSYSPRGDENKSDIEKIIKEDFLIRARKFDKTQNIQKLNELEACLKTISNSGEYIYILDATKYKEFLDRHGFDLEYLGKDCCTVNDPHKKPTIRRCNRERNVRDLRKQRLSTLENFPDRRNSTPSQTSKSRNYSSKNL